MAEIRVQDKLVVDTELSVTFYCTNKVLYKYLQKCFYLENSCYVNWKHEKMYEYTVQNGRNLYTKRKTEYFGKTWSACSLQNG